MKEFISKWSSWWILNPKRKQLDEAFEKELNELQSEQLKAFADYSQKRISVVVESAFIELFDKASCIQHWHNTGKNDRGMVVSSEKVYELWAVLEKYRDLRHSL